MCERRHDENRFLKELGIEQEQIDKIMAENGNDIAVKKVKTNLSCVCRETLN